MIKVLHTGDIHLDSPFSGLSPDRAELRRAELRSAFTSMMTYARTGDIDIVLVTGDLFESRYITRETAELVTGEFSRVGCPVIVSPGNHDPYTHGSIWEKIKMPDNVKVFSSDVLQCFSFPELNTDVYGYAFVSGEMTSVPLASASVADRGRINLICAHADMTSPLSHSAPLSKDVLRSARTMRRSGIYTMRIITAARREAAAMRTADALSGAPSTSAATRARSS
mgnify:CR=1 FL=1